MKIKKIVETKVYMQAHIQQQQQQQQEIKAESVLTMSIWKLKNLKKENNCIFSNLFFPKIKRVGFGTGFPILK